MSRPLLSIIVPTYNRCAVLRQCLDALRLQRCEAQLFEIIVSDDGSEDATRGVVEEFQAASLPAIRYLRQENRGANAARNRAIQAARGSMLLLINDDVIAAPGLASEHLSGHRDNPDERVAVLGKVTMPPGWPASRLSALHLDRAFDGLQDGSELGWRAFFTCNISVKRSFLERAGGFEERIRYHEDLELGERLSGYGLRIVYRPAALGYHHHELTETEFLAIARREAEALAIWADKAPHLRDVLGSLGFDPVLPAATRLRRRMLRAAVNRITTPAWLAMARGCPERLRKISLLIYREVYGCARSATLDQLARERRVNSKAGSASWM